MLPCLPSCRDGLPRCRRAGARQVDVRHDVARRRPDGHVRFTVGDVDRDAQVHLRSVCATRGGDGPIDGLQPGRLHRACDRARPARRVPACCRLQSVLRCRRPRDLRQGSRRALPAGSHRRRARRVLCQRGRSRQSCGCDDGTGKGRPAEGRDHHRRCVGDRCRATQRCRHRRAHRRRRDRSRVRRQLRRHVGTSAGRRRRHQHPAASCRALLPDHRADRGPCQHVARDRGPCQLRLLPRRGRRADDRSVRSGLRSLERGCHPDRFLLRRHSARLGPNGPVRRAGDEPRSDLDGDRYPHFLLRPGELHP